jgi:putative transposase
MLPYQINTVLRKYFRGHSYTAEIIMLFVYMKCRFSLSYRDLEEMSNIRGMQIDHATIQRWVVKFSGLIDTKVMARKKPIGMNWRMDETYIKVKGRWMYLYRAVDTDANTIDFLFRKNRDKASALAFFKKCIRYNGKPKSITTDKSSSNISAVRAINKVLPIGKKIRNPKKKYLNNIIEQEHRFIKKRTKPMLGFKSFNCARNTLTGIENVRMIQKGQIIGTSRKNSAFENFKILMAS